MATVRMTGMFSNMDIDALIKATLTREQARIDKTSAKVQMNTWKKEQYNADMAMMQALKDNFTSALAKTSLVNSNTYKNYTTSLSRNGFVAVSGTSSASAGAHTISSIKQLAAGAHATSVGKATNETDGLSSTNITIKDLKDKLADGGEIVQGHDGNFTLEINGKEIKFSENETLANVINKVNTSGAGVKMSYSQLTDGFKIESTTTGEGSTLTLKDGGSGFFKALGMGDVGNGTPIKNGVNAEMVLDGVTVERTTNTFTIDGLKYTLLKPTEANTGDIDITVNRDLGSTLDTIKNFVTDLNNVIKTLYTNLNTNVNRDYQPLTDEQKAELKEDEIKKWEAEAKKGIMRNDKYEQALYDTLRRAINTSVDGVGSLSSIGISFGPYKAGAPSDIEIDESKLKAALEDDPDKVMNMFMQTNNSKDASVKFNGSGLASRINTAIDKFSADVKTYAIGGDYGLDRTNDKINKEKAELQAKYNSRMEALYSKWATFESQMSKLSSQSDWLAQQLG